MECPICLEPLTEGNSLQLRCCRQPIHVQCYMQCIHMKSECPMCRATHETVVVIEEDDDDDRPSKVRQYMSFLIPFSVVVTLLLVNST